MADDARLAIVIEANTKSMENALKRLEGTVSKSMAAQTRAVKTLDSQFSRLQATALKLAGTLGIAFSARALIGFVKSNIEAGQAIGDLAAKLQISAEATQELGYVADQSGASMDSLATAFKTMAGVIVDAERGTKAAKEQLAELGLTLADLKGKSPDRAFELILDKIGKLQDPLQRTNELVKFFGKSGADLAQLATLGARGIDVLRDKARGLGIVLSNETIAKAKQAGDVLSEIGTAGQAAGIKIAAEFLPAIQLMRDVLTSPLLQRSIEALAGAMRDFGSAGSSAASDLDKLARSPVVQGFLRGFNNPNAPASTPRTTTSPFAEFFTPTSSMPGLAEAAARAAKSVGAGAGAAAPGPVDQTADQERLKRALEGINNQLEIVIKNYDDMREVGHAALNTLIDDLAQAKSGADILADVLKSLAGQLLKLGEQQLGNVLFGATGSSGPGLIGGVLSSLLGGLGKAGGGTVAGNVGIPVGERGPELFVPHTAGRIIPNHGLRASGISNLNVSVDVRGARGNKEIEQMVAQGVHTGLLVYDKTKSRQAELAE